MRQSGSIESHLTDGLLTEELLGRAMSELEEVKRGLDDGFGESEWLRECKGRLDNALRDVFVARDRFERART